MSGQVIPFQGHHVSRRGDASVGHASVDHASGASASTRTQSLEQHMARIALLVEELDDLTRHARNVPPKLLARARVTMDRARRMLKPYDRDAVRGEGEEGDPQPEIDRVLLERLYRQLNIDK